MAQKAIGERDRLSQHSSKDLLAMSTKLSVQASLIARQIYLSAQEREKDLSEMMQEKEDLLAKAEQRAKTVSNEVTVLKASLKALKKAKLEEGNLQKAEVTKLLKQMDDQKAASAKEMNSLIIHHRAQTAKLETLKSEFKDLQQGKNDLAKELANYRREAGERNDELEKAKAKAKTFQKELEELRAEAALYKKALESHLSLSTKPFKSFESSDDYEEVLIELGEVGYNLLRENIIEKGLLTRSQLAAFNYLDAVDPPEDSHPGESSSPVQDEAGTDAPSTL